MKLTELEKEAQQDLEKDTPDLELLSFEAPKLLSKWLRYLNYEHQVLIALEDEQKELFGKLWHHYKYEFEYTLETRQEIMTYVESDEKMRKLQRRIAIQKNKLDYIENVIKTLRERSFHVRNILEYRKFISGA